jgi:hypothetical protein
MTRQEKIDAAREEYYRVMREATDDPEEADKP